MFISNHVKEKISIEVIKALITRFDNFPEDASKNRNAPFHKAFLNAFSDKLKDKISDTPFFISLSSWLHGLNTTLGQTFFERIAHYLCNGAKREYTSGRLGNLQITETQKDHINMIIINLSNNILRPNLYTENNLIFKDYSGLSVNAIDFTADIFIEDDDSITAVELKSVRPNSGEMRGEKQKILEGKAALYTKFPNKRINFFIGFPFDPTLDPNIEDICSHNKSRFMNSVINMTKYFAEEKTLIANELWDLLSGVPKTMEQILLIINAISIPEFFKNFQFINDNANRNTHQYKQQLFEWGIFSEIKLIENDGIILSKINGNKYLTRIYNQTIFDNKGNYNQERYSELIKLLI